MHRVRQWAHSSAHESKFNPWSQTAAVAAAAGAPSAISNASAGEEDKDRPKVPVTRRFWITFKKIALHSWVNVLLVFVPVGIAVHFAGINPNIVFALNAIAIIPLAGLLTFATESVAHRLGPTLGALLNVSFGSAVELIIFIALVKNEIRIVQASLLGSILANLLLILGMAFFVGGLEYREQIYDSTVTQMSASLLALAVLSLLIPLKSHAYMYQGIPQHVIDKESAPGFLARFDSTSSSATGSTKSSSVSSGSHRKVRKRLRAKLGRKRVEKTEIEEDAEGKSSAAIPDESIERIPMEKPLDPEAEKPVNIPSNTTDGHAKHLAETRGLSFRAPPVFRASTNPTEPAIIARDRLTLRRLRSTPENRNDWAKQSPERRRSQQDHLNSTPSAQNESDEPPMSQTASIILLLISTGLVALCAEFLVGSINHLVSNSPLSQAFVGLIILPIVGNAAEHVTAVTVAAKNKLDLALGVSLGSSIQIALFVTPIVVLLGWIMDKDMSLYFTLFETVSLFVATFIVNFLVLDGRSNYLEGALLCACYVIIAVGAYFYPDGQDQSSSTSGPGERRMFL